MSYPVYSSDAADTTPGQYTLHNKIMEIAIIVISLAVFFIFSFHVYAKCFWRHSSSFMMSSRRPQSLYFLGQNVNSAAAHNVGLDKAAIDQLPTFIYKAPKAEAEAGGGGGGGLALLACAVCLSEFQENEKCRLLPTCKHSFHTDCISMWLYSHTTCPLCRTVVLPTPLSSTSKQQQQQGVEFQQGGNAMEIPLSTHDPHEGISVPSTINYGNSMQYPSNVLFWGNQTQVTSQLSSSHGLEKPPSSSTTRAVPQITVQVPSRQESVTSPGCLSLSRLSRCPSPNDQACSSQPVKSSPQGLRLSIKGMLSRQSSKGKGLVGSNQEGGDSPKNTTTLPV